MTNRQPYIPDDKREEYAKSGFKNEPASAPKPPAAKAPASAPAKPKKRQVKK